MRVKAKRRPRPTEDDHPEPRAAGGDRSPVDRKLHGPDIASLRANVLAVCLGALIWAVFLYAVFL